MQLYKKLEIKLKFAPNTRKTAEELEKSIIGGLSVMRSKWSDCFLNLVDH